MLRTCTDLVANDIPLLQRSGRESALIHERVTASDARGSHTDYHITLGRTAAHRGQQQMVTHTAAYTVTLFECLQYTAGLTVYSRWLDRSRAHAPKALSGQPLTASQAGLLLGRSWAVMPSPLTHK